MKDRHNRSKNKAKSLKKEHSEYERVLHEIGFATISDVEVEALQVLKKCIRYRDQYGVTFWELDEQVAKLKRLTSVFKIIIERQPDIKEWLDAFPNVEAGTLQYGRPGLQIIGQQSAVLPNRAGRGHGGSARLTFPTQVNPSSVIRSRSTSKQQIRGSSHGVSRGAQFRGSFRSQNPTLGHGRSRMSIDDVLKLNFADRWFNFSLDPDVGPSS